MNADLTKKHYTTYRELQEYMHGSAEVIGLMMGKIIGMDEQGVKAAKKLGEAMQYTNFLRDIKEDYCVHKRLYIPSERLQPFGLGHADIIRYCEGESVTAARKAFMKHEIHSTRTLYDEAVP